MGAQRRVHPPFPVPTRAGESVFCPNPTRMAGKVGEKLISGVHVQMLVRVYFFRGKNAYTREADLATGFLKGAETRWRGGWGAERIRLVPEPGF